MMLTYEDLEVLLKEAVMLLDKRCRGEATEEDFKRIRELVKMYE